MENIINVVLESPDVVVIVILRRLSVKWKKHLISAMSEGLPAETGNNVNL